MQDDTEGEDVHRRVKWKEWDIPGVRTEEYKAFFGDGDLILKEHGWESRSPGVLYINGIGWRGYIEAPRKERDIHGVLGWMRDARIELLGMLPGTAVEEIKFNFWRGSVKIGPGLNTGTTWINHVVDMMHNGPLVWKCACNYVENFRGEDAPEKGMRQGQQVRQGGWSLNPDDLVDGTFNDYKHIKLWRQRGSVVCDTIPTRYRVTLEKKGFRAETVTRGIRPRDMVLYYHHGGLDWFMFAILAMFECSERMSGSGEIRKVPTEFVVCKDHIGFERAYWRHHALRH